MTIHTAKLQLISSVGLTKITTESKSELECLDSGNFFSRFYIHFYVDGCAQVPTKHSQSKLQ